MDVYLIEKITYKDKNTPLVRSGNRYSSIVPVILTIDDVIKKSQLIEGFLSSLYLTFAVIWLFSYLFLEVRVVDRI